MRLQQDPSEAQVLGCYMLVDFMSDALMTPPCGVLIYAERRKCSRSVQTVSERAWGYGWI